MTSEQQELLKDLERSYSETADGSFQYNDLPTFEFSSPISSIGSNCSSPDRERTIQPQVLAMEYLEDNESEDYVSLEELKSQISPPSDDEYSACYSCSNVGVLETIFEDRYLETPPGKLRTPRPKKERLFRMNLSNLEEFKENVQNNNLASEDK